MMKYKFDNNGLLTGVVQDANTKEVLMVAMMNQEAINRTLDTGFAHFWSRSRQTLWKKGETSGNLLIVEEIRIDCDKDAILIHVQPQGPACHTGNQSCFYTKLENDNAL